MSKTKKITRKEGMMSCTCVYERARGVSITFFFVRRPLTFRELYICTDPKPSPREKVESNAATRSGKPTNPMAYEVPQNTHMNSFRTAVPSWGQTTQTPRKLPPKRDCSPNERVIDKAHELLASSLVEELRQSQ